MGDFNSTIFQEVTKSVVEQLSHQFTMSNITVPRFDAYSDIFDFINEFDTVTATLPEEYKLKILVKAFPTGRLSAWYEAELKPLILAKATWQTVKNKIINRYADSEDRDRHYHRLKNNVFDPYGQRKLFDFVEDMSFSFSKAFPNETEDSKIRYIKAHLPSKVMSALLGIPECSELNLEAFMKGIRKYDAMRTVSPEASLTKVHQSELVTVFKDLLKEIKGEGQKILAAVQQKTREQSPTRSNQRDSQQSSNQRENQPHQESRLHRSRERSMSPRPRESRQSSTQSRQQSVGEISGYLPNNILEIAKIVNCLNNTNGYNGPQPNGSFNPQNNNNQPTNMSTTGNNQRSSSPGPSNRQNGDDSMKRYQFGSGKNEQNEARPKDKAKGFCDEDAYYNKFGYPPTACYNCGSMHWFRHCPFSKDREAPKPSDPLN